MGHPSRWPLSPCQVTLDTLCIAAGQTPGTIPAFGLLPTLSHAAGGSPGAGDRAPTARGELP